MRGYLALGLILIVAGGAEAATINGSTWAEPEEVIVSYDARVEDGEVVRDPQTFTAHWDFTLECTPGTEPGDDMEIFAANTGRIGVQQGDESWTIFDLEPKSWNVSWEQPDPLGPWVSAGSMEITIINEQIPETERNITYFWAANPWISEACSGGQETTGSLDLQNHTIILPGVSSDGGDSVDLEPQTTPGVALPLVLVGIAIVAFKKR